MPLLFSHGLLNRPAGIKGRTRGSVHVDMYTQSRDKDGHIGYASNTDIQCELHPDRVGGPRKSYSAVCEPHDPKGALQAMQRLLQGHATFTKMPGC